MDVALIFYFAVAQVYIPLATFAKNIINLQIWGAKRGGMTNVHDKPYLATCDPRFGEKQVEIAGRIHPVDVLLDDPYVPHEPIDLNHISFLPLWPVSFADYVCHAQVLFEFAMW